MSAIRKTTAAAGRFSLIADIRQMTDSKRTAQYLRHIENRTVFLEWSRHREQLKRSKARARLLAERLFANTNVEAIPKIGVVGSKGKGTAALYASVALASASLNVGSIFSPGVISNRDRMVFNGEPLSEAEYVQALKEVGTIIKTLPPVTDGYLGPSGVFLLAGIRQLLKKNVDVLVLEAGIGGISDELSLFDFDVTVLTEIFGEHLDLLGPTVSDVATNKSGIITARTKEVLSHEQSAEVQRILVDKATANNAAFSTIRSENLPEVKDLLPPAPSDANAALGIASGKALSALLGKPVSLDSLRLALHSITYPGRLSSHEIPQGTLIVDSAINHAGIMHALQYSRRVFKEEPDEVLVSIPSSKDYQGFLAALSPFKGRKTFVSMTGSHMQFPTKEQWPWDWKESNDLDIASLKGKVLAVGTISFSSWLLNQLKIRPQRFFSAPAALQNSGMS